MLMQKYDQLRLLRLLDKIYNNECSIIPMHSKVQDLHRELTNHSKSIRKVLQKPQVN
jgi:hypothetical protein